MSENVKKAWSSPNNPKNPIMLRKSRKVERTTFQNFVEKSAQGQAATVQSTCM
jgi:hypothetical protein